MDTRVACYGKNPFVEQPTAKLARSPCSNTVNDCAVNTKVGTLRERLKLGEGKRNFPGAIPKLVWLAKIVPLLDDKSRAQLQLTNKDFCSLVEDYWQRCCEKKWPNEAHHINTTSWSRAHSLLSWKIFAAAAKTETFSDNTIHSSIELTSINLLKVYRNNVIVVETNSNIIKVFNIEDEVCTFALEHTEKVTYIKCVGDRIISTSDDNTIMIWDIRNGECLRVLKGHTSSEIIVHGNTLFSRSSDGATLRIWDIGSGACLHVLTGLIHLIMNEKLCTGEKIILGDNNTIKIWDVKNGILLKTLPAIHTAAISCLEVHDSILISGSIDGTIRIWDKESLACTGLLQADSYVMCLKVHDDLLISGHSNGATMVWDIKNYERLHFLRRNELEFTYLWDQPIESLQIRGETLITKSIVNEIKIWNITSGEVLATFSTSFISQNIGIYGDKMLLADRETIKIWKY